MILAFWLGLFVGYWLRDTTRVIEPEHSTTNNDLSYQQAQDGRERRKA